MRGGSKLPGCSEPSAPLKAAVYCRLSREDAACRDESESIRNQKSLLARYAMEHGMEIACLYADDGCSGTDRTRPGFNALLADAEARRFEVILVKTLSRFSRDRELTEKYLHREFPAWGVRLIAVADGADTADAANKKARQLHGLVNEWYLEDLSANVRSVLDHKRSRGQYLASFALYGYRKDPDDKNHLIPDPETAPVVRRIFALCRAGYGARRIARLLSAEGILSPGSYKQSRDPRYKGAASGQWSAATLYQILHNPIYTGDMVQGRRKSAGYKSRAVLRLPKEQWSAVPHTHTPLIDRETFDAVQTMLAGRCTNPDPVPAWRPLAGKVQCGGCGSGMMAAGGPPKAVLRCRLNRQNPARCTPNNIPLSLLEEAVWAALQRHLRSLPALSPAPPGPAGGVKPPPFAPADHLSRALADLLIEKVVIFPKSDGQTQQIIQISWKF